MTLAMRRIVCLSQITVYQLLQIPLLVYDNSLSFKVPTNEESEIKVICWLSSLPVKYNLLIYRQKGLESYSNPRFLKKPFMRDTSYTIVG